MAHTRFLARLRTDETGAMLVETALVTPLLVLFSLGAFQVSGIVARQTELESAAAEASAIALASKPDTPSERDTLKQVIMASTGLPSAPGANLLPSPTSAGGTDAGSTRGVSVTESYRCSSDTAMINNAANCTSGHLSSFVTITLSDTYNPPWVQFGVGSPINYQVTRQVMFHQDEIG